MVPRLLLPRIGPEAYRSPCTGSRSIALLRTGRPLLFLCITNVLRSGVAMVRLVFRFSLRLQILCRSFSQGTGLDRCHRCALALTCGMVIGCVFGIKRENGIAGHDLVELGRRAFKGGLSSCTIMRRLCLVVAEVDGLSGPRRYIFEARVSLAQARFPTTYPL